jgi:hypothetical protein
MFRTMAKDEGDALRRWREAEAAYAAALVAFMNPEIDAPDLKKKDLLEMVEMRGKADRWRERYFREGHAKGKD